MSNRIRGIGAPGKIRPAGTIYEDGQTGVLYVQNQSPAGNNWTPLDSNYLDDSTGGGSSFSGGTVQNATNFLSTISSGGTNLYNIFATIGSAGGQSTFIQNGTNTYTGGTAANPTINVSALTINTLTASGNSTFRGTLSGGSSFSASTIFSGTSNVSNLFARLSHSHQISDITNLQSSLDSKAPINSPVFTGSLDVGTENETVHSRFYGNTTAQTVYAVNGFVGSVTVLNNESVNLATSNYTQSYYATNDSFIDLPSPPINGMFLFIKNDLTAGKATTINGNGINIDGQSSIILINKGQSICIQYFQQADGWLIISSYSGTT